VPLLRVAPVYLLGIIFTMEDFTWLFWVHLRSKGVWIG